MWDSAKWSSLNYEAYLCSATTLNSIRMPLSESGRCHVLPQVLASTRSSAHAAMLLPHQALHWLPGQHFSATSPSCFPQLEDPGWATLPLAWDESVQACENSASTHSKLLPCNEKEWTKLQVGAGWEITYECIITTDVPCKLLHGPLLSRCLFSLQAALTLLPEAWPGCPEAAAPWEPCRIQGSVWDRISCTCPTPQRHLSALC